MNETFANHLPLTIAVPVYLNRVTYTNRNLLFQSISDFSRYERAVEKEIKSVAPDFDDTEITQILIQAGAPSLMVNCQKDIEYLINKIKKSFHVAENAMLWYQFDPEIKGYLHEGVKLPFSPELGVELRLVSVKKEERDAIRFPFDEVDLCMTLDELRTEAPERPLSVLLLYGLPGQTQESWEETLRFAVSQKFNQIRMRPWNLKDRDLLSMLYRPDQRLFLKRFPETDPSSWPAFLDTAARVLTENGMQPATAKKNADCVSYILPSTSFLCIEENYLGIGAGAHTCMDGNGYWNKEDEEFYRKHSDEFESIAEGFYVETAVE